MDNEYDELRIGLIGTASQNWLIQPPNYYSNGKGVLVLAYVSLK